MYVNIKNYLEPEIYNLWWKKIASMNRQKLDEKDSFKYGLSLFYKWPLKGCVDVCVHPDGRWHPSNWPITYAFHRLLPLIWSNWVLKWIKHLILWKELTISQDTQYHILWMQTNFWNGEQKIILLSLGSFLFHIILNDPFLLPLIVLSKNGHFSLF